MIRTFLYFMATVKQSFADYLGLTQSQNQGTLCKCCPCMRDLQMRSSFHYPCNELTVSYDVAKTPSNMWLHDLSQTQQISQFLCVLGAGQVSCHRNKSECFTSLSITHPETYEFERHRSLMQEETSQPVILLDLICY